MIRTYEEEESYNAEEVLCPYDRRHRMVRAKLVFHIARCKAKARNGDQFSNCPYNFLHILPKAEMAAHALECPDKAFLKKFHVISDNAETDTPQEADEFTWVGAMAKQSQTQQQLTQPTKSLFRSIFDLLYSNCRRKCK